MAYHKGFWLIFLVVVLFLNNYCTTPINAIEQMVNKERTMLCLGDSYTIGESVSEDDRFPDQCVKLLEKQGIHFGKPHIIAKTGWTTDELIHAIHESKVTGTFDAVTLLIGVNNQYREYDKETYRKEFKELLTTSIKYAGGDADHVFVVSIPDWGVTPFGANDGKQRSPEMIGKEIDAFNAIGREEALKAKVHFTDINPFSKKAAKDHSLIANDNLHPSGKMYAGWAELLEKEMLKVYKK
ncbi:MAG: lysophospholipase [Bacteroidetes bacterium]|nr:lysophospholipase [Bacteroidota bacterium]